MSQQGQPHRDELRFVTTIMGELERVAARERSPRRVGWTLRSGRRTLAVGLGCALLAATGAGAATGLLPVGTVIEGDAQMSDIPGTQPPTSRLGVDQTVAATGSAPVAGTWQLRVHESERVADPRTGEVYQPAGLRCLRLTLLAPPGSSTGAGGCGESPARRGFTVRAMAVGDGDRAEVLLFGRAPEDARAVELTAAGDVRITAKTYDGLPEQDGDLWLIPAPPGLEAAKLRWTGEHGSRGQVEDVSDELDERRVNAMLGRE